MCVAVDKELIVAGFVSRRLERIDFSVDDVMDYSHTLWNAGCGPIRLNFTESELEDYLESCGPVIEKDGNHFVFSPDYLAVDREIADYVGEQNAKRFSLLDSLDARVNNVSYFLLSTMGYQFIFET